MDLREELACLLAARKAGVKFGAPGSPTPFQYWTLIISPNRRKEHLSLADEVLELIKARV